MHVLTCVHACVYMHTLIAWGVCTLRVNIPVYGFATVCTLKFSDELSDSYLPLLVYLILYNCMLLPILRLPNILLTPKIALYYRKKATQLLCAHLDVCLWMIIINDSQVFVVRTPLSRAGEYSTTILTTVLIGIAILVVFLLRNYLPKLHRS